MTDSKAETPQTPETRTPLSPQESEAFLGTPKAAGIPGCYLNDVKLRGREKPLTLVTVSSPEAWPKASDLLFSVTIQYGGIPTKFKFRGVSDAEWSFIQSKNVLPESGDEDERKDPEFIRLVSDRTDRRKVALFELVLSEEIPGNTEAEKVLWIRGQCTISIQNLFEAIQTIALGLGASDLEAHYRMHLQEEPDMRVFAGFTTLNETPSYSFIRGRSGQDYVSVFALNAITEQVKIDIEESSKIDPPPTKPGKLHDGSPDYQNPEPWYDEPMYKLRSVKMKLAKSSAYIKHCLPFSVPDDDWLGGRMVGDILRLKLFIQQELLDPTIQTTFF